MIRKLIFRPKPVAPWAHRGTDLGAQCPARGELLRTELCEIGCPSTRGLLPIYVCHRFTECCPWRWERDKKMHDCVECVASGQQKIAAERCGGGC